MSCTHTWQLERENPVNHCMHICICSWLFAWSCAYLNRFWADTKDKALNLPSCLKSVGVKGTGGPVKLLCVRAAKMTGGLWHLSPGLCLAFTGELHVPLCGLRTASTHGDGSEQLGAGLTHRFLFQIATCCLGEVNLEQFERAVKYPRRFWGL